VSFAKEVVLLAAVLVMTLFAVAGHERHVSQWGGVGRREEQMDGQYGSHDNTKRVKEERDV
jgi:hypothetical protein